jgi:hypothetical protein
MDITDYIATIKNVCIVECPIKSAKPLVKNYIGSLPKMEDTCPKTLFHWPGQSDKSLPLTYPNIQANAVKNNLFLIE